MMKVLQWPVSKDLLGVTVRFEGFKDENHIHWKFVKGSNYVIKQSRNGHVAPADEDDCCPERNWGFKFVILNNKKEYPKLFKTLSRMFGARKAVKLLSSLVKVADRIELGDSGNVECAFLFKGAQEGSEFWLKRVYRSATYSKFFT